MPELTCAWCKHYIGGDVIRISINVTLHFYGETPIINAWICRDCYAERLSNFKGGEQEQ